MNTATSDPRNNAVERSGRHLPRAAPTHPLPPPNLVRPKPLRFPPTISIPPPPSVSVPSHIDGPSPASSVASPLSQSSPRLSSDARPPGGAPPRVLPPLRGRVRSLGRFPSPIYNSETDSLEDNAAVDTPVTHKDEPPVVPSASLSIDWVEPASRRRSTGNMGDRTYKKNTITRRASTDNPGNLIEEYLLSQSSELGETTTVSGGEEMVDDGVASVSSSSLVIGGSGFECSSGFEGSLMSDEGYDTDEEGGDVLGKSLEMSKGRHSGRRFFMRKLQPSC